MAAAGDRQDDHGKLAALRLVNTHGIGQADLVPLATLIDDFISIEVDGKFILLRVGLFARQEVGAIAHIAVKDLAFSIVDQMNDLVPLPVLAVWRFKDQLVFF